MADNDNFLARLVRQRNIFYGIGVNWFVFVAPGDLLTPNPEFCRVRQETIKYGIYILSQLTDEDFDRMRQEKILSASMPNLDF